MYPTERTVDRGEMRMGNATGKTQFVEYIAERAEAQSRRERKGSGFGVQVIEFRVWGLGLMV